MSAQKSAALIVCLLVWSLNTFSCRNFIVSTVSSIVHVKTSESTTQILLQKDCKPLRAVACHPKQSMVAMGNESGVLQMWDYSSKTIVCRRLFENNNIQCIAIDSQGSSSLPTAFVYAWHAICQLVQKAKVLSCSFFFDSTLLGSWIQ